MEFATQTTYNCGMSKQEKMLEELPKVNLQTLVKNTRSLAGYTQAELAQRLACSVRSIQDWEAGLKDPGGEFIAKLFLLREELLGKFAIPIEKKNTHDSVLRQD